MNTKRDIYVFILRYRYIEIIANISLFELKKLLISEKLNFYKF